MQGSQVVNLAYDALGRRTRLTLPNGNVVRLAFAESVVIDRDVQKRMLAELRALGYVANDANGGDYAVRDGFIVPNPPEWEER